MIDGVVVFNEYFVGYSEMCDLTTGNCGQFVG